MWVLIFVVFYGNGSTPVTQEFTSEENCRKALNTFSSSLSARKREPVGVCTKK
jgi:hypothetical protein